MERKCAGCEGIVQIDRNNSNQAIRYKKRFYHFDCFVKLCDEKIANKRTASSWIDVKEHIDDFVKETTKDQQNEIAKDELAQWVASQYGLSCISSRLFMKLNDIYSGTFHGLAYPILPTELLEEWKYFWDELCAIRKYKAIVGEQAVNYDVAILLNRNAEYRKRKQSEQLAREIQQQQKNSIVVVDTSAITKKTKKHKIADLYIEMTGGENNE
jgi:hypothetical protein